MRKFMTRIRNAIMARDMNTLNELIASIDDDEIHKVINAPTFYGTDTFSRKDISPLGIAIEQGNLDIMRLLIAAGADIHQAFYAHKAVFYLFESNDHPEQFIIESLKMFKTAGMDLIAEKSRYTLLGAASAHNRPNVVQFLLQEGFVINQQEDHSRLTPLMIAVLEDAYKVIPVLIQSGADMTLTNYLGDDVFKIAVEADKAKSLAILEQYKLDQMVDKTDAPLNIL